MIAPQEPRNVGDAVQFQIQINPSTEPTWTTAVVEEVRTLDHQVGDSNRVYVLKLSNGELYDGGQPVAQNKLFD